MLPQLLRICARQEVSFLNSISSRKVSCGTASRVLLEKVRGAALRWWHNMATLKGNCSLLRKLTLMPAGFTKVVPRLTAAYNNRDHRKILIDDGQIGYTGGVSGWVYQPERTLRSLEGRLDGWPSRPWRDSFSWTGTSTRERLKISINTIWKTKPVDGEASMSPFGSGPETHLQKSQVGKVCVSEYASIRQQTMSHWPYLVVIMIWRKIFECGSPWCRCTHRDPFHSDKKLVKSLRESDPDGSRGENLWIHPGFIHNKQVLAIDEVAVVGTVLWLSGLVHHYENAVWMYRSPELTKIRADFEEIFFVSQRAVGRTGSGTSIWPKKYASYLRPCYRCLDPSIIEGSFITERRDKILQFPYT